MYINACCEMYVTKQWLKYTNKETYFNREVRKLLIKISLTSLSVHFQHAATKTYSQPTSFSRNDPFSSLSQREQR